MSQLISTLVLLVWLVAAVSPAADPAPSVPADTAPPSQPIPVEQLVVTGSGGTTIPFQDLIGPDGRAVS